ncbi:MAG: hypothetical protein N4A41_00470 [Crocinitomicaceae bacterium]|jgi:hypothetical protein|nr:hypothetical protein [Crocinitomicaceae bacterium]
MHNPPANTPENNGSLLPAKKQQPILFEQMNTGASKLELIRNNASLSLSKLADPSVPTLGQLTKENSPEKVEQCVGILISDLSESFDKDLKENQIEEIVVTICSGLNLNLKLETVYLACQKIKQQPNYGKLNVNKVLNTIQLVFEEQLNTVQQANLNKHLSVKENRQTGASNESFKKAMHKAKVMYQSGQLNTQPAEPKKG